MNIEIKDEILDTSGQLDNAPRYLIRDNNGNIIFDNVQVEMKTPVLQEATKLNKELLEKIQVEMLKDSKQLVAEYTSTSDLAQIDITGLDMLIDGGVYDVVLISDNSSSSTYGLAMRVNGIEEAVYHNRSDSTSSTNVYSYIDTGNGTREVGVSFMTLAIFGEYVGVKITSINPNGSDVSSSSYTVYIETTNITSMTFYDRGNGNIKSGFNIKIYKRR